MIITWTSRPTNHGYAAKHRRGRTCWDFALKTNSVFARPVGVENFGNGRWPASLSTLFEDVSRPDGAMLEQAQHRFG